MTDSETDNQINFLPEKFPEKWASEWGEDQYGLWMAFTVKNVHQVFRWILPGTFQMGSPESEKGRFDREFQHQVTLTQGYWLAETVCTQALWLAVMKDNPASFNEDDHSPVDRVSWNDTQEFLNQLNVFIPGLDASLPSEAQWEYACRAGTTTVFSFGDNITTEEVNYNGDYPYVGEMKGMFRQKTVRVKSLPVNPWGLYEMHGNVWEWCEDWFAHYSQVTVSNPRGAERGAGRVLRGGSWFDDGGRTRSADRSRYRPAFRDGSTGFRFALSQASRREAEVAVSEHRRLG